MGLSKSVATEAWAAVPGARTELSEIARALDTAGVCVDFNRPASPSEPGIVVFDQVDDEVLACVRDVSGRGAGRVLAVAAGESELSAPAHWRLLEEGASDVVVWSRTVSAADVVKARLLRWAEIDAIVASPEVTGSLVGTSGRWRGALRRIVEAARFTSCSVLVTGETGTGKELVARMVHALDQRPEKRGFVVLDCTTVVPALAGSEFFGHERGAFTGAVATREGAFALADGGTLFLDEVGELPPTLQSELLRVVQERTFKKVGGSRWQKASFRLVCATNRDLVEEQATGRFRSDLYYRIAEWVFTLPPLRERPEDILPLTRHFLAQARPGHDAPELDPAVASLLVSRPYPGNVRELRQLVSRISHRHVGPGPVTVGDVPEDERPPSLRVLPPHDAASDVAPAELDDAPLAAAGAFDQAARTAVASGATLKSIQAEAGEAAIRAALSQYGSLKMAARRLGVTERALQLRRAARRKTVGLDDEEASS